MTRLALLFFVLILSSGGIQETKLPIEAFYMPAEWEPYDAIWLAWEKDSSQRFRPSTAVPRSNQKEWLTKNSYIYER